MSETEKNETLDSTRGGLRFSIGQLLFVTAIVSVVLMLIVTLAVPLWSLAMSSPARQAFFDALFGPASWGGSIRWSQYIQKAPHVIVWVVGSVLLIRSRKLHPRVSQCALAGLLLLEFIDIGLSVWVNRWLQNGGMEQTASGLPHLYLDIVGPYQSFIRPVIEAGCWVLILMAVLGWRGEADGRGKTVDAK